MIHFVVNPCRFFYLSADYYLILWSIKSKNHMTTLSDTSFYSLSVLFCLTGGPKLKVPITIKSIAVTVLIYVLAELFVSVAVLVEV